ncbi:MAG: hypothetical protein Aurels2KO_47950 [Aureliella sp.]
MRKIWPEPTLYQTPFGSFQAEWSERGLYSFRFVRDQARDVASTAVSIDHDGPVILRRAIETYLATGELPFGRENIDWSQLTDFTRAVLQQCLLIPAGRTWTYGTLAARSGSSGASRAVGMVMARNRWPLIIPCHRVVGGNGKLTGYSGDGGLATKQRVLEFEATKTQSTLF